MYAEEGWRGYATQTFKNLTLGSSVCFFFFFLYYIYFPRDASGERRVEFNYLEVKWIKVVRASTALEIGKKSSLGGRGRGCN